MTERIWKEADKAQTSQQCLLGIMSAAAIATGSVNPAFAADTQIASFTKEYQANIPDGAVVSDYPSPIETFTFQDSGEVPVLNQADLMYVKYTSFNAESKKLEKISDLTNPPTSSNTPMTLNLGTAAFDVGDAGTKDKMSKTVSISIPDGSAFTKPDQVSDSGAGCVRNEWGDSEHDKYSHLKGPYGRRQSQLCREFLQRRNL